MVLFSDARQLLECIGDYFQDVISLDDISEIIQHTPCAAAGTVYTAFTLDNYYHDYKTQNVMRLLDSRRMGL